MTAAVLGYIGFLIHTILQRRRFNKDFTDLGVRDELPAVTSFFMDTPAPLYVAMFTIIIALLIVKEIAIEKKRRSIRVNVAALVVVAILFGAWIWYLPMWLTRILGGGS